MDVLSFLDSLTSHPDYQNQSVHTQHLHAAKAKPGALDRPLPGFLQERLEAAGMPTLYSHQAAAINLTRSGRHVMIATPAASGKSLCYNVPVLETMLLDKSARALYLFPTKALAQDQLRALNKLADPGILSPGQLATFDGDTPAQDRGGIKKLARLVITNPDMLHVGILPNHQAWSRFLRQLKFVVLDEAHVYRGIFGSHVAEVMRRMRRICSHYGSSPQFICASATIANPEEHARQLTGIPFTTITEDGSPHGKKLFTFWNPPLVDPAKMTRRSPNSEASFLFSELIKASLRTIVFTRTRKLTELIFRYTRDRLPRALADRISPYRAGYLAEDRRAIERRLFQGELLGVVATTALELGVDIGDLEATVLTGYPGSISSTWQQAGRSGRGSRNALSFLIGQNNPLDQYFMRHPDFFFGSNYEAALINPGNPHILKPHLVAAAWEIPLGQRDRELFGEGFEAALAELEKEGKLKRRDRWYPTTSITYPAQDINIRSTGQNDYILVDVSQGYRLLEMVPSGSALSQLHAGAIYFHQGDSYLIKDLDLESRTALAEPTEEPHYTVAKELTSIRILRTGVEKSEAGVKVCLGDVEVTGTVVGYKRKRQYTEEVIEELPLELPPQHFVTRALWFDLPSEGIDKVVAGNMDFPGALHALEHAAIAMLPLFALCDRNDIGGVSTIMHVDTGRPQVFIYDAYPGGIGISEKGYEIITRLWRATLKAIAECPCQDGCPACVQSPKCGNNNEPLDKKGAKVLLEELTRP